MSRFGGGDAWDGDRDIDRAVVGMRYGRYDMIRHTESYASCVSRLEGDETPQLLKIHLLRFSFINDQNHSHIIPYLIILSIIL